MAAPCGRKRKLQTRLCPPDCKKCKDKFGVDYFVRNEFYSEKSKNQPTESVVKREPCVGKSTLTNTPSSLYCIKIKEELIDDDSVTIVFNSEEFKNPETVMAAKPTESAPKDGPLSKITNTPSSQDCIKVKEEFVGRDSVRNEFKSEELENPKEVMATKHTESSPKCGSCSKKRKLRNTPSSQDCKKCKEESDKDDSLTNELKFDKLKKPEKIMAAKPTVSTPKCGHYGKKRKLRNTPSLQDCEKCKEECDKDDCVTSESNLDKLKKPEKISSSQDCKQAEEKCVELKSEEVKKPEKVTISCAHCGFSADSIYDFPLHIFSKGSTSYYCDEEECQKAGLPAKLRKPKHKCGLCYETRKLLQTECCGNWICSPVNGCRRNHERYSLCGYHCTEGHEGHWYGCKKCKADLGDNADNDYGIPNACVNCDFTADALDAFPLQVLFKSSKSYSYSRSYYCAAEKCQKAGLPVKLTKRKRAVKKKCQKAALSSKPAKQKRQCGLCGKTRKLTKTECCDNWICDDEHKYRLFSFALNSCHRNHRRYTLCAYHHTESHQGHWQDCKECYDEFSAFDYNDYGTGSFNFEQLKVLKKGAILCANNCGLDSDSESLFPLHIPSKGYYCYKGECQKAGSLFKV